MQTGNIYDSWRGRMVIPESIAKEGKFTKKSMKYLASYFMGQTGIRTFYNYQPKEPLDIKKSKLEKSYEIPYAGNMIRSFIRVSDRGMTEKLDYKAKKAESKAYKKSNKMSEQIIKNINEGKIKNYPQGIKYFWDNAKKEGWNVKDLQKWKRKSKFYLKLKNVKDKSLYRSLLNASTQEGRTEVLKEYLNKPNLDPIEARIIKKLMEVESLYQGE
jgi:membrane-associated HD superfamily phosphohydrolase